MDCKEMTSKFKYISNDITKSNTKSYLFTKRFVGTVSKRHKSCNRPAEFGVYIDLHYIFFLNILLLYFVNTFFL